MIYEATNLIKEEMDRQGMKYSIREYEDSSELSAGFGIQNGPCVNVTFISRGDRDVALRLFEIVHHVSDDKIDEMQMVLNKCNNKYRFVKFVLDEYQNVNIAYDFPPAVDDASFGKAICEMFIIIMKIANEVYPELMQVFCKPQPDWINLPEDPQTH